MEGGKECGGNRLSFAAILGGVLVNLAPPLGKLLHRMSHGEPAITQARHTPQSVLVVASRNPNWNRFLDRFRLHTKLFELKVLSCKGKSVFSPQAAN
jgi:hypothetical protein